MLKRIAANFIILFGNIIFHSYHLLEKLVKFISTDISYKLRQKYIKKFDTEFIAISHLIEDQEVKFFLHTPNWLCRFRGDTFSNKEPETLKWIDEFGDDGAFYDIGANVGLYSLYFAKTKKGNVYSFEPSVFNLRQLAKNISINDLSNKITIIPNPLSDKSCSASFTNGNIDEGGALSAFGVDYGYDGKKIESDISYALLGFALDDLLTHKLVTEPPVLVKIDVDGIEHLILKGALKTLSHPKCKSILVEVNEDFEKQSQDVSKILNEIGFKLHTKEHAKMFDKNLNHGRTYNQIWVKG